MKSFLVIGIGSLGQHICHCLADQKCEVMAVDINPEPVEEILPYVVSAKVADCTKLEVIKSFGVSDFDGCFVCVASSFQASLQVTSLLKECGAKKIYSKADGDIHEKFLLRNGADKVIYPERDVAERVAISASYDSVFDHFELSKEFSIYEISPPEKWIGKSVRELDVRAKYNISILAKRRNELVEPIPDADYVFIADEHIFVLGRIEVISKLAK